MTKADNCKTISEVVERNTGMEINDFLKDTNTEIVNLQAVANRLNQIATEEKTVTVFGDYDCDGICSSIIMHIVLMKLGVRHEIVLPKRSEGYGLKVDSVKKAKGDVIITVDNGIAALDAIKEAKNIGKEVIVIDHHLRGEELPNADLMVDPHVFKNNEDDFEDWCAAGLCYELSRLFSIDPWKDITLQFATLATIADVVPLKKDNRRIVKEGLKLLNSKKIFKGIDILYKVANGDSFYGIPKWDETAIAFKIAPILNAVGRVNDDPIKAFEYFLHSNKQTAQELVAINEKRKTLVADAESRAKEIIESDCLFGDIPLIIYDPETPVGIVGIVAGKLAEEYSVPTICLTGDDVLHGSARAPYGNIKEALDAAKQYLITAGGHKKAAGLSLKKDKLNDFAICMYDNSSTYFPENEKDIADNDTYDLEIDPSEIGDCVQELSKYAPFGEGNRAVRFMIKNYKLYPRKGSLYRIMGKDGSTVKLYGNNSTAIGFKMAEAYNATRTAKTVNLYGELGTSINGEPEITFDFVEGVTEEKKQSKLAELLASKLSEF